MTVRTHNLIGRMVESLYTTGLKPVTERYAGWNPAAATIQDPVPNTSLLNWPLELGGWQKVRFLQGLPINCIIAMSYRMTISTQQYTLI
jgi:hypothetical protein